jgi:hypothetical protein
MRGRLTRIVLVGLAVALLAAAGIAVNVLLLEYADSPNDPVGKLSPRADSAQPMPPTVSDETTTTDETSEDEHGEEEDEEPDD